MLKKFKSLKANKKGFTLAELLIVVAIIAVLAAIAIPVFAAQLDKAREQVDEANLRSAISLAQAEFLTSRRSTDQIYYFNKTTDSSVTSSIQSLEINLNGDNPSNDKGDFKGQSSAHSSQTIIVTINANGSVNYTASSTGWISAT